MVPKDSSIRKAKRLLALARQQLYQEHLPFSVRFSLRPLLAQWMESLDERNPHHVMIRRSIEDYISEHPNLLEAHDDEKQFLQEHDNTQLDFLFGSVFPPALSHSVLGYVAPAFSFEPFYITWGMFDLLDNPEAEIEVEQYSGFQHIPFSVRACFIILNKVYGLDLDYIMPYIFKVKFGKQAPRQYYKTTSILDFLEVKMTQEPPEISQAQIDFLLKNPKDADLWLSTFSPEIFYFEGIFVSVMNEVTDLEVISRLRRTLLASDSLLSPQSITTIEGLTNIYLRLPDSRFGVQALEYPQNNNSARYKINFPLVRGQEDPTQGANLGSIYEGACAENHIKIISDLRGLKDPRPIEQALINAGFRSLMLVPLRDQHKNIIGIVELGSTRPYAYNYVKSLRMKEVLSLYDLAMEENREGIDNKIQAIIQDKFTHIHPSVMWKFTSSAFQYLDATIDEQGQHNFIVPPVFRDVQPLYGQIDINNSTLIRNDAVRYDLINNLRWLEDLLKNIFEKNKISLLHKSLSEVTRQREAMDEGFSAHLEADAVNLIRQTNMMLRKIAEEDALSASLWINEYLTQLDPDLDTLNDARSRFDESVRKINRTITSYLDSQEATNQKFISHLFEKFQTDGIEYNFYLGQSLLEHGSYGEHHLQNMRLWQIKSMIEIQHLMRNIRPELPIDLSLSYLIYVHDAPISIRFRLDEKRFDVEGAHDVRYEILKKRLDKALLKDGSERLTANGKIVIAYIQKKDKNEYLKYLQYLISEGLLDPTIEEVEIEPLQGVVGLGALRVQLPIE